MLRCGVKDRTLRCLAGALDPTAVPWGRGKIGSSSTMAAPRARVGGYSGHMASNAIPNKMKEPEKAWKRTANTIPRPGAEVLSTRQRRLAGNVWKARKRPFFSASSYEKLLEICVEVAEDRGMSGMTSMEDILSMVLSRECAEYTGGKLDALDALLRGDPPTDEQLRAAGIERIDDTTRFEGPVNYLAIYAFYDEEKARSMCDKMETEMGIRQATVDAFRAKIARHDWASGQPLLLGMSGEGQSDAARKYSKWMADPPSTRRARAGRQEKSLNPRTDGFYFLIPAAATLVGDGCLEAITVETYVIRKGDGDRNSREAHEMLLVLGVLRGLLFDSESLSLNQKVGGYFKDEQQWERGGGLALERLSNLALAGPTKNKTDLERTITPVTSEGSTPAFEARRARGLCLGITPRGHDGFAQELANSINFDTGAILVDVELCNKPNFQEPGHLTRGLCTWKLDENGNLVLGYHSVGRREHPTCRVGGTVPAVQEGGEWRVAKWALPYIKAGKIVRRYQARIITKRRQGCTSSWDPKQGPSTDVLSGQQRLAANVERAWNKPSFAGHLPELQARFDGVARSRGMNKGLDMATVLSNECAEYAGGKLDALDALLRGDPPTDEQLRAAGIERIDDTTRFEGPVNYLAIYAFYDEEKARSMCDKMETEMGICQATVDAFRAKMARHDWASGQPLRLGKSGEGRYHSARKFSWWMRNPPDARRARAGRRKNPTPPNDGFFFLIPAAATLVGDGCLEAITVETFVVRRDEDRNSREAHEMLLVLGVLRGLLFDSESLSLYQEVRFSITDEPQRREGAFSTSSWSALASSWRKRARELWLELTSGQEDQGGRG